MENVPMGILLQPSRDVANFADSINRFANTVMTLDGQERQREATAMRLAHVSEYGLKLTDAADGIFTGAQEASAPDMPTFQQMLSDTFQSSYDRLQKATADDPILRTALSREHNKIQLHYGTKFRDLDRTKKAQFAITQVFDSFLADGKKYMEAATPDDEAFYVNRIADTINRAEISQAITPEKIYEYRATLEGLTNKKTITKYEFIIDNADQMTEEQRMQARKDLVDPTKLTNLSIEERRSLINRFRAVDKEMNLSAAYQEASRRWTDPEQAKVEVLKPEFMQERRLDINQAQNMAQSFSVIASQKKIADKDRQEKNLDEIRAVAIKSPAKALRLIQTSEDLDPKDALALQRATESHIRQMSLMSAQEKSVRLDIEDKEKAGIKANISAGLFKSEQDLVNTIISKGFSNTSAFIDDAVKNFKDFKKDAGAVNFFKSAEEDWDKLIQTTAGPRQIRKLQDMKPKVLEGLRVQMEREGLRTSDPKVFELYQANRKALTATWGTKAWEGLKSIVSGGDSFVAPPAPPPKAPVSPATMDEATARKRLTDKKVTGKAQDDWIQKYRDAGVIK